VLRQFAVPSVYGFAPGNYGGVASDVGGVGTLRRSVKTGTDHTVLVMSGILSTHPTNPDLNVVARLLIKFDALTGDPSAPDSFLTLPELGHGMAVTDAAGSISID